jgi:hypothetical protein
MTTPRTCERCDTVTSHRLCDRCSADEFDDRDRDDEPPEFEFDCGMLADGTCMLAGSEDCDWECPYGW